MLIKAADDREHDLVALKELLMLPNIPAETKSRIEKELKNIRSGIKGESDAAYEINFHYEKGKNWAVIHDLRLEHNGKVAQIDHLLINRLLEVWVCESKRIFEGIAINEQGECSTFFNGRPSGIASPFEQNRKHCVVLQSIFDEGLVKPEKRLGFTIKPVIRSLILVSKNARISRPKVHVDGVNDILKVDQIKSRIDKVMDEDTNPLTLAKLVSSDTLERFAQQLAVLHKPGSFNWLAKFGVSNHAPVMESALTAEPDQKKSKLVCRSCEAIVGYNVAKFCWANKSRFGGDVYCYACQKSITGPMSPAQ